MHLAAVLAHGVRATDLIGRMGGEEFVILLPRTSLEATRKLAEKLRLQVMGAEQVQAVEISVNPHAEQPFSFTPILLKQNRLQPK